MANNKVRILNKSIFSINAVIHSFKNKNTTTLIFLKYLFTHNKGNLSEWECLIIPEHITVFVMMEGSWHAFGAPRSLSG